MHSSAVVPVNLQFINLVEAFKHICVSSHATGQKLSLVLVINSHSMEVNHTGTNNETPVHASAAYGWALRAPLTSGSDHMINFCSFSTCFRTSTSFPRTD